MTDISPPPHTRTLSQDCCFCQEQDDGTNACGYWFGTSNFQCCTKRKEISSDDAGSYDVRLLEPPLPPTTRPFCHVLVSSLIALFSPPLSWQVVVPPVDDFLLRSACCCGYFGCACKPRHKPLGISNEQTILCGQQQCGAQCLSTRIAKVGTAAATPAGGLSHGCRAPPPLARRGPSSHSARSVRGLKAEGFSCRRCGPVAHN